MKSLPRVVLVVVLVLSAASLYAQDETHAFQFVNEASEDVYLLVMLGDDETVYYHVVPAGRSLSLHSVPWLEGLPYETSDGYIVHFGAGPWIEYAATNRDYTAFWTSPRRGLTSISHAEMLTQHNPVKADGSPLLESELKRGTDGLQTYHLQPPLPDEPYMVVFTDENKIQGRQLFDRLHYAFEPSDYGRFPWGADKEEIIRLEEERGALQLIDRSDSTRGIGDYLVYFETFEIDPVLWAGQGDNFVDVHDAGEDQRSAARQVWYYFTDGLAAVVFVEAYPEGLGNDVRRFLSELDESDQATQNETGTMWLATRGDGHTRFIRASTSKRILFTLVHPDMDIGYVLRRFEENTQFRW